MKPSTLVFFSAAAAAGIGLMITQDVFSKYEEPSYEVKMKDGNFEIREYPSLIGAEVEVKDEKNAENRAFKILAGYIFGKNQNQKKISMTIPVTMENFKNIDSKFETGTPPKLDSDSSRIAMTAPVTVERANSSLRMRFYMPSTYTLETLPVPKESRIILRNLPAQTFAVLRFSGFLTRENADHYKRELQNYLQNHGYKEIGEALTTAYNPPWTLPFLRRNEIWIPVES